MKHELVHTLTGSFEGHAQETENGVEYRLARDLQHLLHYTKWDNFLNVIAKAKTACEVTGHDIADHFADVGKMVELSSGSQHVTRGSFYPRKRLSRKDIPSPRHSRGGGSRKSGKTSTTSFPRKRESINFKKDTSLRRCHKSGKTSTAPFPRKRESMRVNPI